MPLGPSVLVVAGSDVPQQYKPPVRTLMQLAPSQSERVPRFALGYQKRKLAMERAGQRITKQNKLVSISAWSLLHVHNFEIMIILGMFILCSSHSFGVYWYNFIFLIISVLFRIVKLSLFLISTAVLMTLFCVVVLLLVFFSYTACCSWR